MWKRLRLGARWSMRSAPLPVRLVCGSDSIMVGRDGPRVTVTGDPVELALFAFGRQRVAVVGYEGTDADVTTIRDAHIAV